MVVPAKVAERVGKGPVKSMPSKAAATGVHDNLVDKTTGLTVAKSTLMPVERATAGAAGTRAARTDAAGGAMAVAAPLVS